MSTDIETRVRAGLADAPTPAGLGLDADAVTRIASRAHRRHRTGQALLGGMAALALTGGVAWGGGWLPGEVQRVLPASPWSSCPLTWNGTGYDVRLAAVDHAVLPLPDGGTVVAGVARGCPEKDQLFFAPSTAAPTALPETLPQMGGFEDRPGEDRDTSWFQGLRLEDGREVTAMMAPRASTGVVVVGPDAVHEPTGPAVRVPGTRLDAFVLEDYWPAGEDLAHVWRGADGLVHTAWSAGITARVWQGSDPGAELTDTWVGQDQQDQQWVMHRGQVQGPFPVSPDPYAVAFPAEDHAASAVVVVLPEAGGQVGLAEEGLELDGEALRDQDGNAQFSAELVRLRPPETDEPLPSLVWTSPDGQTHPVHLPAP